MEGRVRPDPRFAVLIVIVSIATPHNPFPRWVIHDQRIQDRSDRSSLDTPTATLLFGPGDVTRQARSRRLHREMAAEWLSLARRLMEEATVSALSIPKRLSRIAAGNGWFLFLHPLRQPALGEPEIIDAFHQDFECR